MLIEDSWESLFEYCTVFSFQMLHPARNQARPGLGVGYSSLCPFSCQGLTLQGLVSVLGSSLLGLPVWFLLLYFICGKKVQSWCLFSTCHVCWPAIRALISSNCAEAICALCVSIYVSTVNTTETSYMIWKDHLQPREWWFFEGKWVPNCKNHNTGLKEGILSEIFLYYLMCFIR